jgi:hypothetical protein
MSTDDYFRKPKKARGSNCHAWWYANPSTIEIHVQHADSKEHACVYLTRRQLVAYLERTKPRAAKAK